MGAHVVFFGPSTAGKTSLMLGLCQLEGLDYDFTVDRTWTTRPRRLDEDDQENIFVPIGVFEALRPRFYLRLLATAAINMASSRHRRCVKKKFACGFYAPLLLGSSGCWYLSR